MTRNGILCVEGDWDEGLRRRRSLVPVLDLLRNQWNIPYIHRTANTRDEFGRVIREWTKARYGKFPILYLGFHGAPGSLHIGSDIVPLRDLHEFADKGRGRLIHFGSCETLRAGRLELAHFLKRTQFTAICGFRHEVDWLHSCALEILILDLLSSRPISPRSVRSFQQKLKLRAGTLSRSLGFQVWERGRLTGR